MLLFLIKKTFFDIWDNLLAIFLFNIGFLVLISIFIMVLILVQFTAVLLHVYLICFIIICNVYIAAVSRYAMGVSDYEKPEIRTFLQYMVRSWKQSIISSLVTILLLAIIQHVIPFYLFSDSLIYNVLGYIMGCTWLTVLLASPCYFPVSFRLNKKIMKSIKSSFFFLFDNTAFTLFMFLVIIIAIPVSLIFVLLFPGPAGIIVWIHVCVKIRLYKYDYMEAHPGANRKKIPWRELIREDEERVGKHTLRGMIFPWKS